jgi:parallel beta-helix repeat protein
MPAWTVAGRSIKEKQMRALPNIAVLGMIVGVALPASAETMTFTVDCSSGGSIAAVLARGDARKPIVLKVRGTCREAVLINRDDVTLQGDPRATIAPPDTNARAIDVSGSDVNLINLDVVGGNLGISFNGTARAVATDCTIRDTRSDGVRLFAGDARLQGMRIDNAGGNGIALHRRSSLGLTGETEVSGSQNDGIYATLNSVVSMTAGVIHDNGRHGAEVENGAQANFTGTRIEGNTQAGIAVFQAQAFVVGDNTISGNHEQGIVVLAGANATVDGNFISENQGDGVTGYLGGTIVMHGNEITGNGQAGVACNSHCTLQIGDEAKISGNSDAGIVLVRGSVLILEDSGVKSQDNGSWGLWCGDTESRVGGLENLTGTVSELCSTFNN